MSRRLAVPAVLVPAVLVPAVLLAFTLGAPLASAHINLQNPPARHDDPLEDQKVGPCGIGDSPRSADPMVLQPGEMITIQWDETIDHEGHYRLAFLADGDAFPNPNAFDDFCDPAVDDWCVADDLADDVDGTYTYDWIVPETPCDNCTLQLLQIMTDADGFQLNDLYFDCADVVILDPDGSTSATTSAGAGGDGAGGSTGSGDGGASSDDDTSSAGPGGDDDDGGAQQGSGGGAVTSTGADGAAPRIFPEEGGCSVAVVRGPAGAAGVTTFAAPLALGLAALALRRRRSR